MQRLYIYICISVICASCAQITPLTGGKKDMQPPKVVKMEPKNASLNFVSKDITIHFDEYIVLKDIVNQFIITPQTKELPDIEASGKKVKIKFNESLLPNTTYKLFFGNAISDLRESNSLQNFEYIFSTGNSIDSLTLKGQVINYYDKKPASQILVGLYPPTANDSIIYKEKPLYINKTNDKGEFKFNYLPNTSFKVVGIKDQNKNLLYDGSDEQVSYCDELVNPNNNSDLSLVLFKEVPFKSFIKRATHEEYGRALVVYNKPQADIVNVTAKGLTYYLLNQTKDTLNLYYNNKYDTLTTIISYQTKKTDTLYIKIPSVAGVEKLKKEKLLKYSIRTNIGASLPIYELPRFNLNFPIKTTSILQHKISLIEKNDTNALSKPFTISASTLLTTSFTLSALFKPETNYTLIFNSVAFAGDSLRTNDSTAYNFKTTSLDDYAQLNLKLMFPKKENYILLLLNEKENSVRETKISFSLTSTSEKLIEYKNLLPGNYFLKVVEDANKNGLFDTGDYFLHQQPESIFINDKPIKLLSGWEVETEWTIK